MPAVALVRGRSPALPSTFVLAAYLLGFVISVYGVFVRRVWFVTEEVDVPIPGLDPRFDGYRIAHLSDLHIGTMTPKETGLRWTRAANRAAPDLAVITGDLVTSGTLFYDDIAAVVGDLRARDGVFVSMGNHDYFGDGEPLVKKLRATGAKVLRNEGLLLERGASADGQPHGLWLSAIDDTWTRRDDLERALEKCPATASAILLAHDPARFPAAAAKGVALTFERAHARRPGGHPLPGAQAVAVAPGAQVPPRNVPARQVDPLCPSRARHHRAAAAAGGGTGGGHAHAAGGDGGGGDGGMTGAAWANAGTPARRSAIATIRG